MGVRGNPWLSGIGDVTRNNAGLHFHLFLGPSGFGLVNETELCALWTGLCEVARLGFKNFIMEGDSFCLKGRASGSSKPSWHLVDLCEKVMDLATSLMFPFLSLRGLLMRWWMT